MNAGDDELRFPRPVPIGPHAVAWVESEVDEWIEGRLAAREDLKENPKPPRRKRVSMPSMRSLEAAR
jgi:hypothetical protein